MRATAFAMVAARGRSYTKAGGRLRTKFIRPVTADVGARHARDRLCDGRGQGPLLHNGWPLLLGRRPPPQSTTPALRCAQRACVLKNRSISPEAFGPWVSVYEPVALPPYHAWPPPRMIQCSTKGGEVPTA